MSAPEIPSGWDTSLSLPSSSTVDHLAALTRIQTEHALSLGEDLLAHVYGFAREQLAADHDLPNYDDCQALLYLTARRLSWQKIYGGLQYNAYHNGEWLGVRVPLYELKMADGDVDIEPLPPMEPEGALDIALTVAGVARACNLRHLPVTPDLTGIQGDTLQRRIIQVDPWHGDF